MCPPLNIALSLILSLLSEKSNRIQFECLSTFVDFFGSDYFLRSSESDKRERRLVYCNQLEVTRETVELRSLFD